MSVRSARHERKRPSLAYIAGGIVAGLVVMAVAYRVFLTIPVKIDASDRRLMVGTRVSELFKDGLVHGDRGNLVAAKDRRILKRGGGDEPFVLVNGKRAANDVQLYASDVVKSMNGLDVVEPLAKRLETVTAPVRYEGSGQLETIVSEGHAGRVEVTYGTLSKQVVARRVVQEAVAQVVRREQPKSGSMVIALTFDDGPWPGQTEAILKILKRYGVKATFFEIGAQARGRPQLSKMLADAGMLVENHSQSHPDLSKYSADRIQSELAQAQTNIEKATGKRPRYFRPPGGATSPAVRSVAKKLGLRIVDWDIDTRDWRKPPAAAIVSLVLSRAKPGAVVLMHDGGGDRSHTIEALPKIIEGLKAKGYQFVTLDGIADLPQGLG